MKLKFNVWLGEFDRLMQNMRKCKIGQTRVKEYHGLIGLLCKHQWNTRWAFARKHDISTCEKITIAMATLLIAPFTAKKTIWYVIGVYVINRTSRGRKEMWYFSSSARSLVKYFSTLEEKFRISARPCDILWLILLTNTWLVDDGARFERFFQQRRKRMC